MYISASIDVCIHTYILCSIYLMQYLKRLDLQFGSKGMNHFVLRIQIQWISYTVRTFCDSLDTKYMR
jgi:hypothetical protein